MAGADDRTAALHAQSGDLRVTMVTPLRPPLPACSASYTFFLTLPLLYMTCGVLVYLPTLYSSLHAFFLCPHLPTVLCSACVSALQMLHWPRGNTLVSLDNCCCWCVLFLFLFAAPEPDGPFSMFCCPFLVWFHLLLLRAAATLPTSTLYTTSSSPWLSAPNFAGGSLASSGAALAGELWVDR